MVLIPPDIGLRLRAQNELLPQPITPLQEIPSDLPDLKTGQTFNARIQEVLPENTYRALVGGKSVTLSLPESVKSGDVLELVVVDRSAKTIIAQLAAQGGAATAAEAIAYPHTTLSQAARLIVTLLPEEGKAPAAAPLNRGQPLLAQPPQAGSELAPFLGKAVTESGLFYESHQAQWVAGKLPLASLMQEPQGTHSSPQAKLAAQAETLLLIANARQDPQAAPLPASPSAAPAAKLPSGVQAQEAHASNAPPIASNSAAGSSEAAVRGRELAAPLPGAQPLTPNQLAWNLRETAEAQRQQNNAQASQPMTAASIPPELRPLVQQQLDAAGTQRLLWHGEVWPGQTMQWEIEWKDQGGGTSGGEDPEAWATTLRLSTPRLGEVEAALRLGAGGVHIALITPSGASVADLRAGAPLLDQALASAGVPMLGFTVRESGGPESGAGDVASGGG